MGEEYRCPEYFTYRLTGLAIREYLQYVGEGYPYEFYVCFKKVKPSTSYASIRRYFYILKRIGLIEPTRTEPSKRGGFPRTYYRIVVYDDPRWLAPQEALYPETRLGPKRYKAYKAREMIEEYPYGEQAAEIQYYIDMNQIPSHLRRYVEKIIDEVGRRGYPCESLLDVALHLYRTNTISDARYIYHILETIDAITGYNSARIFEELTSSPNKEYLEKHGREIIEKYCR